MSDTGHKNDRGKVRMDLVPLKQIEKIAEVLTFGAKKYEPEGWKKVPDAEARYFAATLRHLSAWQRHEDTDEESGLSHLAHAATNLLFLLHFEDNKSIKEPIKFNSLGEMDEAGITFKKYKKPNGEYSDLIEATSYGRYINLRDYFNEEDRLWYTVYDNNLVSSGIHWTNALYYMKLTAPLPEEYYYGDDHFFKYCEELDD